MYIILNDYGVQVGTAGIWLFETLESAVTYLESHSISPASVNIYALEWAWGDGEPSD